MALLALALMPFAATSVSVASILLGGGLVGAIVIVLVAMMLGN